MALNDMIAAGGTDRPNVLQSLIAGKQTANQMATNRLQQLATQQEMAARQQAMEQQAYEYKMSRMPLEAQAKYSADIAKKMAETLKMQDDSTRAQLEHSNKVWKNVLGGVLSLPPQQQPMAYQQGLSFAARNGADMTDAPREFNPDMANVMYRALNEIDNISGSEVTAIVDGKLVPAVENKQGQIVHPVTRQVIPGAIKAPTRQLTAEGSAADLGMTTSTRTSVQKDLIDASSNLQQATEFYNQFMENPDALSLPSRVTSTVGGMVEFATGKPVEGKAGETMTKKENLESMIKLVKNNYRKWIAGVTLTKNELENVNDTLSGDWSGQTEIKAKMKNLTEVYEKSAVRLNQLNAAGFSVKKTDDGGSVVVDENGVEQELPSLSAIPSFIERKNELIYQSLSGKDPKSLTQADKVKLEMAIKSQLAREGYSIKLRRD